MPPDPPSLAYLCVHTHKSDIHVTHKSDIHACITPVLKILATGLGKEKFHCISHPYQVVLGIDCIKNVDITCFSNCLVKL